MSAYPAPAAFSPLESPGPASPELRFIQGGGEGVLNPPDFEHPDLYAIPDLEDSITPEVEDELEDELSVAEDSDDELAVIRQNAAERAGRIVRAVSTGDTVVELTQSYDSEHHHRGGGGVGWALRKLLLEQAAKEHKAKCNGCHECSA